MTTMAASETRRDARAAIDKAISLLVSFGDDASTGVGVSELAHRAELSKSTAFRVLGLLERNGVIERTGRQYRLGKRLHDLGRHVYSPDHDRLRDLLIPFVTDVFVQTRETVHLAVLHGTDVVYLAKLYGHRRVPSPSRIGGRIPAYCTAVGKVLLAHNPDALDQALAAPFRRYTPRTVSNAQELLGQVAAIHREGLAYDRGEIRTGLSCVAVPVVGSAGRPVAAMSVSVATGRADVRTYGPVLRRVAADATRMLSRVGAPRRIRST